MSASPGQLSFEVLRFVAAPISGEVALLELEGRFRAGTRRRLGVPRLVAEHAGGTREIAPAVADEASAEPDGVFWRASYAVALDELGGDVFSLAVGRELLVGLPAPDHADDSGDREVRLAREANALRRTADEARAAAAAALASVAGERRTREEAEGRLAELQLARDDFARRVASVEDELAQARRDHAAELVRRDEERTTLLAGHEAAQTADERVAEIEAEVVAARRDLRAARAEAEAYRRDLERERERVEAAEASVRRGRVTEIDGEPVGEDEPPPTATAPVPTAPLPDAPSPTAPLPDDEAATEIAILDARQGGREEAGAQEEARRGREEAGAQEEAQRGREEAGADEAGEEEAGGRGRSLWDEAAAEDETDAAAATPGETVRVLGRRRPRRSGEGPPAEAAPGTAEIGARFIEPGQTPQRSSAAAWITRVLALAALAVVIVAILLVLKPF